MITSDVFSIIKYLIYCNEKQRKSIKNICNNMMLNDDEKILLDAIFEINGEFDIVELSNKLSGEKKFDMIGLCMKAWQSKDAENIIKDLCNKKLTQYNKVFEKNL